jgi:hypothetical protein
MKINYQNEEDYWSVITSLFMLEVKSQLHYNVTTKSPNFQSFLLKELSQKPNMLILKFKIKNSKHRNLLNEYIHHDLVLMKSSKDTKSSQILGIIENSSKYFIRIKILFQESSPKHQIYYEMFTLDSVFEVKKLCGLSTIGREFVGLDNIRKVVLKQCLLNPKKFYNEQKIKKNKYLTISREMLTLIKNNFNEAQVKAIKNSLKVEGVTLIQGPPGTGKTKLIMGILAVLFGSEPKKDNVNQLSDKERERILKSNQETVGNSIGIILIVKK